VDQDPSVKRLSGTIDTKEQKQTFQGQDDSVVIDRKDELMDHSQSSKLLA
jgi:hypothetical protein